MLLDQSRAVFEVEARPYLFKPPNTPSLKASPITKFKLPTGILCVVHIGYLV